MATHQDAPAAAHSGFVATTHDDPARFYGVCAAGDFRAPITHDDQADAQKDADAHVAAVS